MIIYVNNFALLNNTKKVFLGRICQELLPAKENKILGPEICSWQRCTHPSGHCSKPLPLVFQLRKSSMPNWGVNLQGMCLCVWKYLFREFKWDILRTIVQRRHHAHCSRRKMAPSVTYQPFPWCRLLPCCLFLGRLLNRIKKTWRLWTMSPLYANWSLYEVEFI